MRQRGNGGEGLGEAVRRVGQGRVEDVKIFVRGGRQRAVGSCTFSSCCGDTILSGRGEAARSGVWP